MLDHVRGLLGDHDHGRIGVARHHLGHDGSVNDAEAADPVELELVVDDRAGVVGRSHLGRAGVVVDGGGVLAAHAGPVFVRPQLGVFTAWNLV